MPSSSSRPALPFWAKLSLPAFVFGAAILLLVGSLHAGISDQESSGARINVAGRQRTLNQKIHKEAIASVQESRAYDPAFLESFEQSANALLRGGEVRLGSQGSLRLDRATDDDEIAGLESELELVARSRALVERLAGADPEERGEILDELAGLTAELHVVANDLVLFMQERSRSALGGLGNRALLLALFALLAGSAAAFLNVRGLTRSFDEVGGAARSLAQGMLSIEVDDSEPGPVGRMARDLNAAVAGIRASLGADEVDWETIADERDKEGRVQAAMLTQAPAGLMHADADRIVRFANDSALELLGRAGLISGGQLPGKTTLLSLLGPLGLEAADLEDEGRLPWTLEVAQNGLHLRLQASAIRGQGRELIGWLLTLQDDTERARREAAAAQAAERERSAREALDRSVAAVLDVVGQATGGDLSVRTGLDGEEPVERVGSHLDRFLAGLESTMAELSSQVADLGRAAADLDRTSDTLGTSAEETEGQARSAAEASKAAVSGATATAAGIQQVTVSIDEISSNAATAALVANEAVEVAAESNRLMQSLGARSQEIDDVIKVITAIASQTNLLALNATIEAARAGDAGKGFAVVANEVKGLATETSKATGEISGRIEAIQSDISEAIAAIENIGRIIGRIDETQTSIAATVEEQSVTAREMARGVEEAARGTEGVRGAIDAVAEQATQTAQGSRQSKDAARVVGDAASRVDAIVQRYRSAV